MKRQRNDEENEEENTEAVKRSKIDPGHISTEPLIEDYHEKSKSEAKEVLAFLTSELCRPPAGLVEKVLGYATALLKTEPNVLKLQSPITCVGDIHAEWYDLKKVFELSGNPENGSRFIFLGDYVDRGFYGVECLVSLAARKILYPNDVFLIRGNHEDAMISSIYGHKKECEVYYSLDVYEASCDFFKALPLCATVDKKYFCCHGGIPNGISIEELDKLDRNVAFINTESEPQGTIADLLWSDPGDNSGGDVMPNRTRGCGSLFNEAALDTWHKDNDIILTIRAHQLAKGGVFWQFNNKLVTVFSASDYCRQMGNDGGILLLSPNLPPKGITWTPTEIGFRKKIFGREIVHSLLFQSELQESDSESDDEDDTNWDAQPSWENPQPWVQEDDEDEEEPQEGEETQN